MVSAVATAAGVVSNNWIDGRRARHELTLRGRSERSDRRLPGLPEGRNLARSKAEALAMDGGSVADARLSRSAITDAPRSRRVLPMRGQRRRAKQRVGRSTSAGPPVAHDT